MRNLIFKVHAFRRMLSRGITEQDERHVLDTGEIVETYPDDTPFPSRLVLGRAGNRPRPTIPRAKTRTSSQPTSQT